MTRKKFVKRLMAKGVERNVANAWAKVAQRSGMSYEQYYRRRIPLLLLGFVCGMASTRFNALSNAVANIGNAAKEEAKKLRERMITI